MLNDAPLWVLDSGDMIAKEVAFDLFSTHASGTVRVKCSYLATGGSIVETFEPSRFDCSGIIAFLFKVLKCSWRRFLGVFQHVSSH